MSVTGRPSHRHELHRQPLWPGYPPPSPREERLGALGYVGAIVIIPVVPLLVYLTRRQASQYVHSHSAQALNVALTCLLYAISGAIVGLLLALDSGVVALAVMLPVAAIAWGVLIWHLMRGASAAARGDYLEMPHWICSPFVR
jgi:uncharacterized membrane protein